MGTHEDVPEPTSRQGARDVESRPAPKRPLRTDAMNGVLLFVGYLALAKLSTAFLPQPSTVAPYWLPSGLTLAVVVHADRRALRFYIPAIFLGELSNNLYEFVFKAGVSLGVAAVWGSSNSIEPLIGAWILRRAVGERGEIELSRLREVGGLIVAALVSPLASTLVAAPGLVYSFGLSALLNDAFTWWFGDASGILLVAPVVLTLRSPKAARSLLGALPIVAMLAVSLISLSNVRLASAALLLSSYVPLVVLLALAVGRKPRDVAFALAILDFIVGWQVTHNRGPFAGGSSRVSFLLVQGFVCLNGSFFLLLAAAANERRQAVAAASASASEQARLLVESREALRRRDEFLGIAAHELYTPLTSLQLGLQGLISGTVKPTPENVKRVLGIAARQTKKLGRLIAELLDVTRIRAGRLEIVREELDLVELAREVVEHSGADLERAGCAVLVKASGPARGRWDRDKLEQVIANLLSNAIKFGAGKPIDIEIESGEDAVKLAITDRGIGIAPDRIAHIFDRFERAVSPRSYGGLGLGLYIARGIIEGHGGTIRAESEPGERTTFTVELPLKTTASGSEASNGSAERGASDHP